MSPTLPHYYAQIRCGISNLNIPSLMYNASIACFVLRKINCVYYVKPFLEGPIIDGGHIIIPILSNKQSHFHLNRNKILKKQKIKWRVH